MEAILDFLRQTGFYLLGSDPKVLIMMAIACVLLDVYKRQVCDGGYTESSIYCGNTVV